MSDVKLSELNLNESKLSGVPLAVFLKIKQTKRRTRIKNRKINLGSLESP